MKDALILLLLPGVILFSIGIALGREELLSRKPLMIVGAGMVMMGLAGWASP